MIEVFKTNVSDVFSAGKLISLIADRFPGYQANFDLEDCDRILRIKCASAIDANGVISLLNETGARCEVLLDEIVSEYMSA